MKKKIAITALTLVFGAGLILAVFLRPTTGTMDVPDVSAPWDMTVRDPIRSLASGALAVHVSGELDGDAVLHTSYGDIALSSGRVDTILVGSEAWLGKCHLAYEPGDATHGQLSIRVGLGSGAGWARRPIGDTVPANYVGGWTTWYPGGKKMYSKGFFFRGKKKGTWSYWKEDGTLLRTEEWKEGELVNTGTANNRLNPISGSSIKLPEKD